MRFHRILAMALIGLFPVGVAHAGAHVVLQGEDPGLATARVAVAVARPPGDFFQVDWPTHRETLSPTLLGVGSLIECTEEATDGNEVGKKVKEAEGALNFMEHSKVLSLSQEALAALACVSSPVDAEVLSRFHFLMGVVYIDQGDKPSAWASFQKALVVNPTLTWDENFPPDSKPVFIAAQAELGATPPSEFVLVPAPSETKVWIDGREVAPGTQTVELVGGSHWLQWEDDSFHTATLQIDAGPQVGILLPSTLGEAPLYMVTDPSHYVQMSALMATVGAPGDEVFLTTLGGVWRLVVGERTFEQLVAPTEPVPEMESSVVEPVVARTPINTRALVSRSLLYGGAGVAIVGGGLAVAARGTAMEVYDRYEAEQGEDGALVSQLSEEEYWIVGDDYRAEAQRLQQRVLLATGGVVAAGVGFGLGLMENTSPVTANGWASPDGAGMTLTLTR